MAINLLPTEMRTGKDVVRASQTITRLAVVLGVLFVVFSAVGGGVLILFNSKKEEASEKQTNLKSDIQKLETTEKSLFFIKDRVQKSQSILTERVLFDMVSKYDELVTKFPDDMELSDILLDKDNKKLTLKSVSSKSVASILQSLIESDVYDAVSIDSLEFNAITGYKVTLDLY